MEEMVAMVKIEKRGGLRSEREEREVVCFEGCGW